MKNISMIACVGKNLELGKNNDLIWHLPNDLKYFKKMTDGKTVIMGRHTFESLPKVLSNRRNIVLTSKNENNILGIEVFNDIPSILNSIKDDEEAFVIGGASVYQQFLEYADKIYLTEVNAECFDATVFFPKFDKRKYKKNITGKNSDNGVEYTFVLYERRCKK